MLAACSAPEFASEYPFDPEGHNGALTYWLVDALQRYGSNVSCKQLHSSILAKIHSQFQHQTPQLQGEADRLFFGSDYVFLPYTVPVLDVNTQQKQILLNTGQIQGTREGAQFAIYPLGANDFTEVHQRRAIVEITQVGGTNSWATVITSFGSTTIQQGDQALLLNPGTMHLRKSIRLFENSEVPVSIDQKAILFSVRETLAHSFFLDVAADETPAQYQVMISKEGTFEILDAAGMPISNLRPALLAYTPEAPSRLKNRLEHLARYENIKQLNNTDLYAPRLIAEFIGVQSDYNPVDPPKPRPFDDLGHTPVLKPGEWTFLRIKNASLKVLNITVLDLAPDWSIGQIFPPDTGSFSEPLDPGQHIDLPLRTYLPGGYTDATDTLQIFATVGSTNFRYLELPALDQPPQNEIGRGQPTNSLEELLAALATTHPTRQLELARYPTREWTTRQVEVRVRQL